MLKILFIACGLSGLIICVKMLGVLGLDSFGQKLNQLCCLVYWLEHDAFLITSFYIYPLSTVLWFALFSM